MMESLAAALQHSREQAQHTYDQRTANEKKAAALELARRKAEEPAAEEGPSNPKPSGGWTIRGACGRGQHVAKAVDLPGTSPSIPTRRSSLPAVVQERRRRSLLAPTGQQSVNRVQAITCAN